MATAKLLMILGDYLWDYLTQAVTDGMLVTAPAWPAHPAWLAMFQTVLVNRMAEASNLVQV